MNDENLGEILVVCRFRPLNEKENNISNSVCVDFCDDKRSVSVPQEGSNPLLFNFDHVFTPSAYQEEVYNMSAKSIIESVMQGYNGTVLAYGQTSSGKTFTMTGELEVPHLMGITPRMVSQLFEIISNSSEALEFTVKISYCELYMEKIRDLIDPLRKDLKIHEDKLKGIYISNLSETYVNSETDVYDLMKFGTSNREVGYTDMNKGSSRSHAVFLVSVSQTNTCNLSSKSGKLFLVDLAGSEKVGKTGASGKRLEEAKTINKSLTVLGLVITNLTDQKSTHIPYRDSKLTRILQDSLGGNSRTSLIITCSPSVYNLEETISTLRFGVRAKNVKNKPKVNKEYTVAELKALLLKSQEELGLKNKIIEQLQIEIRNNGGKIPAGQPDPEVLVSIEEVYEDLEGLKDKLEQETVTSAELREELAKAEVHYQELLLDNSSMMTELKLCHEEMINLKIDKEKIREELEELKSSIDIYANQISGLNLQILNLQQATKEKDDLISQIQQKCQTHISIFTHNDDIEKLQKHITNEQERYTTQAQLISSLQDTIQELSKKSLDIEKLKESLSKDIQIQESSKFQIEKEILTNDLQNRIIKVIELQQELEETKETLRLLESKLSQGDKALIKRNDLLERNIDHIKGLYYRLLNEKTHLTSENEVMVKKIIRLSDRIKALEEQFKSKELNKFEETLAKINNSLASGASRSSAAGRVRKPIKGGIKLR